MKRPIALVFLCTLFFSLWLSAADAEAAAALPDKLLRLRVVAASDAPDAQARKLLTRDAALAVLSPRLADCASLAEAASAAEEALPLVEAAAAAALRAAGDASPVIARLGKEAAPLRRYESFALPAGRYETLTLTIGAGEGRNWWCVVFPPLCLAAAGDEEDAWEVFSPGERRLLTADGRVLRFRVSELWEGLCGLFRR